MAEYFDTIEIPFNKIRVSLTFYMSVSLLLVGVWAILLFTPYLLSFGEFWIPLAGVMCCMFALYGISVTRPKLSKNSVGITISDEGFAIMCILDVNPRLFLWQDIISIEKIYSSKTKNLLEVKYIGSPTDTPKSFSFTTAIFDCGYNELFVLLNKKLNDYKKNVRR